MKEPRYYGPNYQAAFLHLRDGTPSTGRIKTLEGQLQTRLDALHLTLAMHGPNDPPLTGPLLAQTTRTVVKAGIFDTAKSYPQMYVDAVPAGQTAEGLAWFYWNKAREIFTFYGR